MPHSVWRRVRARVHLSLTPSELSNPVRAATNRAFSSLLMRYNSELGGVVVAYIAPVQLSGPPTFIGASPFPHVIAIANLLVFAPTKGSQLLGVVTHVGPDHLGLSVLSAFHAVLPIDDLSHMYHFDTGYSSSLSTPSWNHLNGQDKITANRQIRFVVSDVKPTRSGLFQIIASLDHTLRDKPDDSHPLGLLPPDKQIFLSGPSKQSPPDGVEPQNADLPEINRRHTEAREIDNLTGDDLLISGNDGFGDALMPIGMAPVMPLLNATKRKKGGKTGRKKGRVDGVEHDSFSLRESQHSTENNVSAAKTPRRKDRSGDANGAVREAPGSQVDERSERKKRRREKKKKKETRASRNEEEVRTLERDAVAGDAQDSGTQLNDVEEIRRGEVESGDKEQGAVKQEDQAMEQEMKVGESGGSGVAPIQSAKTDERKKKKKKKKRKEILDGMDGPKGDAGGEGTIQHRQEGRKDNGSGLIKHEEQRSSENATAVKTEMTMMGTEDDGRAARTVERGEKKKKKQRDDDDDHRKMKKKRKRSSEGEVDSEMKRKKKKHKKRLSLATEER